jgi:hypothetical protein
MLILAIRNIKNLAVLVMLSLIITSSSVFANFEIEKYVVKSEIVFRELLLSKLCATASYDRNCLEVMRELNPGLEDDSLLVQGQILYIPTEKGGILEVVEENPSEMINKNTSKYYYQFEPSIVYDSLHSTVITENVIVSEPFIGLNFSFNRKMTDTIDIQLGFGFSLNSYLPATNNKFVLKEREQVLTSFYLGGISNFNKAGYQFEMGFSRSDKLYFRDESSSTYIIEKDELILGVGSVKKDLASIRSFYFGTSFHTEYQIASTKESIEAGLGFGLGFYLRPKTKRGPFEYKVLYSQTDYQSKFEDFTHKRLDLTIKYTKEF